MKELGGWRVRDGIIEARTFPIPFTARLAFTGTVMAPDRIEAGPVTDARDYDVRGPFGT